MKVSSRKLLAAFLKSIGIEEKTLDSMYALLDKKPKIPADTFKALLDEKLADKDKVSKILAFMETDSLSKIEKSIINDEIKSAIDDLAEHHRLLSEMGVSGFYKFDPSIVRGLAYYTGIVFEVHALGGELRAICGGGRYDNLLKDFGGPDIPAVGMGFGDCVLEILLREKGLLDKNIPKSSLDYFIVSLPSDDAGLSEQKGKAVKTLAARLRKMDYKTDFSYKSTSLSKFLQEASGRSAKFCIILGDEFKNNELVIKDMKTGEQQKKVFEAFLSEIKSKEEV